MLETSRPELLEIVGDCLGGPQRPRGLVLCDPLDPAGGWSLVAVVPDSRRPAPEVRFYPSGGLERVASLGDGFVLQVTTRERAEAEHGELLALIRRLPAASASLDDAPQHVSDADLLLEVEDADDAVLEPEERTSPFVLPADAGDDVLHELPRPGLLSRIIQAASAMLRPPPPAPVRPRRRPTIPPRRAVAGPVSIELIALPPAAECTEPEVAAFTSEV
jgi:hypothetical protein